MQPSYTVYLLLGSNIQPEANIQAAIHLLRGQVELYNLSPVWETPAVGSNGPNFLNLAAEIRTPLELEPLKQMVLRSIEARLGRVRTPNKNAPRSIDLDIMIYDRIVMEPNIWRQAHIACPLASLLPDLVEPQTGITLSQIAARLRHSVPVRLRRDLIVTV
jgi:2-amino-4-hydroxy-6-hydroxymethyldihydropteridine diphosphokinase